MQITAFVWPEDRLQHIALHSIEPEEFEQVCFGKALVLRAKSEGKNPVYYVLGETGDLLPGRKGVSCYRARDD